MDVDPVHDYAERCVKASLHPSVSPARKFHVGHDHVTGANASVDAGTAMKLVAMLRANCEMFSGGIFVIGVQGRS